MLSSYNCPLELDYQGRLEKGHRLSLAGDSGAKITSLTSRPSPSTGTLTFWDWVFVYMHVDLDLNKGQAVLRIRDVYPRSEFFPSRTRMFSIPDPNYSHSGSAANNLSILTQNIVSKLSEIWSCSFIPDLIFTHSGSRIRIRNTAQGRLFDFSPLRPPPPLHPLTLLLWNIPSRRCRLTGHGTFSQCCETGTVTFCRSGTGTVI